MGKGYYTLRIERLRESFGGRCAQCGSDSALEFAHLRPTGLKGRGRGLPQRVHDITKNPDAYKLLCHTHHALFDGRNG